VGEVDVFDYKENLRELPRLFPCQFLLDLIGVYEFSIGGRGIEKKKKVKWFEIER
jgi:hypothetical protein